MDEILGFVKGGASKVRYCGPEINSTVCSSSLAVVNAAKAENIAKVFV